MPLPIAHSGHIRIAYEHHILRLTLARPDKRNALTRAMYLDLDKALAHGSDDPATRVIQIDGEGNMFCAGNDIADFLGTDPSSGDAGPDGPALRFVQRLAACDKPVVAAVQGQATGIGTTLLLHTDMVVAADDARFYTAFPDLGLVPEAGSSRLLPQQIGAQNAARLLLAGDSVNAEEALRMGLVAYCVPAAELAGQTAALAQRLADKPPGAMAATKRLLRAARQQASLADDIAREAEAFGQRLGSAEVRDILRAFVDRKRKDHY